MDNSRRWQDIYIYTRPLTTTADQSSPILHPEILDTHTKHYNLSTARHPERGHHDQHQEAQRRWL